MKNSRYKTGLFVLSITAGLYLFLVTPQAMAAKMQTSESAISHLEHAAVNYEWAAMAQKGVAQNMFSEAEKLRDAPYGKESEYLKNLRSAADKESRSADYEVSAGANYDHASALWTKVALKRKKSSESSQDDNSSGMATVAREKATISYLRAAEIYELAAQAYFAAKLPLRQASLSQKAGRMREKLAQRVM